MNLAITRDSSKRLKIQFRVRWNNSHADAVSITLGNQCFKKLRGRQADLGSNRLGRDGELRVKGDLTIHGVTKEVILNVDGPSTEEKDPYGNSSLEVTSIERSQQMEAVS
jgi:polyisoprenoid-binding protein YceI